MLVSEEIMNLNSDLSLMNIGDSSVVSDVTVVKEQHSKYRRRSFLKLEPTIFEDFATIRISDSGEAGNVKSKRRRTVSKKRPLPTESDGLEHQDCSIMNDTCVDFSVIETLHDEEADLELTVCKNTPLQIAEDNVENVMNITCGNFSNNSAIENLINQDDKSIDLTCSEFSFLDNSKVNCKDGVFKNEQVKSKRRRTGHEKISATLTEDIMEDNDEELSVMNVTCGNFDVLIQLGDEGVAKENVVEKPKPRRSLRKKIQPLNTSTQVLGSSQVSTSIDNYSDIEQYYLCKKYKRLPNSLETIFEEPMQKNNKNLYISARKFNRTIKFGGNSASANLSKIKKRITRASKLVSSKKFLKRRKVSMKNLLKALSTIDELD